MDVCVGGETDGWLGGGTDGWMCGLCEWLKDLQFAIAVAVHYYDCIVLVTFKGTVSYTFLLITHSRRAFFVFERPRIFFGTEKDSP
jgi:hypothetical protein